MISYAAGNARVNWAARSKAAREHLQNAHRQLDNLSELRKTAAAGEKSTLDEVQPLFKQLVEDVENLLDQAGAKNRAQIAARAEVCSALASLIAGYVQYGNARERLAREGP